MILYMDCCGFIYTVCYFIHIFNHITLTILYTLRPTPYLLHYILHNPKYIPKKRVSNSSSNHKIHHISSRLFRTRRRLHSPTLLRLSPLLLQTILLSTSQQLQVSRLDRETLLRHSDEAGCEFLIQIALAHDKKNTINTTRAKTENFAVLCAGSWLWREHTFTNFWFLMRFAFLGATERTPGLVVLEGLWVLLLDLIHFNSIQLIA
jgi:hypothetical protein